MVDSILTNHMKNKVALLITGSNTSEYISHFIIGTGSETVSANDTILVNSFDRQPITSISYPSSSGITFQGDWSVSQISGLAFTEWGLIGSATGLTGSIWTHHNIPSITFDGTSELRITETLIIT